MYICSSTPLDTQRAFKVIKRTMRSMSKNSKAVFLMKHILHSYKVKDREGMFEGFSSLCSLSPDLAKLWKTSKRTYDKAEGDRIHFLYKLALRQEAPNQSTLPFIFQV